MKLFRESLRLFLAVCLFGISPIDAGFADAAPPHFSQESQKAAAPGHHVRKKRKSPNRSVSVPTIVQDVRVVPFPDHTRLVFDLQRSVTFTQNRQTKPDRVVIRLHNSLLGKTALARLSEQDFPNDVVITQTNHTVPQSVLISLDLD
ncbi:MAG: AMIN domain-containing protein, partial [Nitrospiraceae bacterium]